MNKIPDFNSPDPLPAALDHLTAPGLPAGYFARQDGIWMTSEDGADLHICGPVALLAFGRSADHDRWVKIFEFIDLAGSRHRLFVPNRDLHTGDRDLLATFLDHGFWVANGAGEAVRLLLCSWETRRCFTTYPHHGWLGDDHTCFSIGKGQVIGADDRVSTATAVPGPGRAGTLEGWRDHVAGTCVGNPLLLFAVSHALAAPLLAMIDVQGGGAHVFGGRGATISALLGSAASVWDHPRVAGDWRTADRATERMRNCARDRLMVLDHICDDDAARVGDILSRAFPGAHVGRKKARDGSSSTELRSSWLSAGSVTMSELLTRTRGRVGSDLLGRVIDIPGSGRQFGGFDRLHDAASEDDLSRQLMDMALQHHGHAGPAFVAILVKNSGKADVLRKFYESCLKALGEVDGAPATDATRRAVERFAVVAAAGELATRAGITGWAPNSVLAACLDVFRTWVASGLARDTSVADAALERLTDYIAANPAEFAPVASAAQAPDLSGYHERDKFYFTPAAWREIHGDRQRAAAQALKAEGHLIHHDNSLQYRLPRTIMPSQPKVYAVRMQVPGLGYKA